MPKEKHQESSQDLLNYSIALNWLKTTFPEEQYNFKDAAKALSDEIKRRIAPSKQPEQPDA